VPHALAAENRLEGWDCQGWRLRHRVATAKLPLTGLPWRATYSEADEAPHPTGQALLNRFAGSGCLGFVALVLVAVGRSRVASSWGRCGGFPVRACRGVRTWRRAAAPGPEARGRRRSPSAPGDQLSPGYRFSLRCWPPVRHASRRDSWHLRVLTSHRPHPPMGGGGRSPPLKP
jgi:hypothetical protein